jgi:hypothetical protein
MRRTLARQGRLKADALSWERGARMALDAIREAAA